MGSHSLLQGNLLNPGIEPRSLALQADSLSSESPGKPLGSPWAQLTRRSSSYKQLGLQHNEWFSNFKLKDILPHVLRHNEERNRHLIISTEKSASRTMKEGRFYSSYFQIHKFAYHSCMDVDRRYKTYGSETKDCEYHVYSSSSCTSSPRWVMWSSPGRCCAHSGFKYEESWIRIQICCNGLHTNLPDLCATTRCYLYYARQEMHLPSAPEGGIISIFQGYLLCNILEKIIQDKGCLAHNIYRSEGDNMKNCL